MIAYKLFRTLKSRPGELFPLFINKSIPVPLHRWVHAECHPTPGFANRPGWHTSPIPYAPHLMCKDGSMPKNRLWVEVEVKTEINYQSEANQAKTHDLRNKVPTNGYYLFHTNKVYGGIWIIAGTIKINRTLSQSDVEQILTNHRLTTYAN